MGPQVGYRINELQKKYPEQAGIMHILDPSDFALLNSKKVLKEDRFGREQVKEERRKKWKKLLN